MRTSKRGPKTLKMSLFEALSQQPEAIGGADCAQTHRRNSWQVGFGFFYRRRFEPLVRSLASKQSKNSRNLAGIGPLGTALASNIDRRRFELLATASAKKTSYRRRLGLCLGLKPIESSRIRASVSVLGLKNPRNRQ